MAGIYRLASQKAKRRGLYCVACLGLLVSVALCTVHFEVRRHLKGIFLLTGKNGGSLLELKDDLYLGGGHRLSSARGTGQLFAGGWHGGQGFQNGIHGQAGNL
jgi:hypothetical protein